ncbi:MAG TPA: peptidoglycan-binding domain-containing protein [Candidatus Limiplasma sp.]|nr:peptidoglycan-binding domain-containing protein [Candidatus Limiplasma sp.]HRX09459.1 peptidoglycan-binding domain-containing protein [Candidatus Limiplasma sp.]
MKTMMRNGKTIRRSLSFLLMVSLLIALLPMAANAVTAPGAYGTVTVTTKNVVIRTSPAGSRTGYFAQPGDYPMIGPAVVKDGVTWYNLQTDRTSGYVHGSYATGDYGSAGMPSTDKTYVKLSEATKIYKGDNASSPVLSGGNRIEVTVGTGSILQLVTGTPYAATYGGTAGQYVNVYNINDTTQTVYHTPYTTALQNAVMSTNDLNTYISEITWKAAVTSGDERELYTKGDYMTHAIQAALTVLGYYEDDCDGSYGPNTYAAIEKFQKANSLSQRGVANTETLEKLFPQAVERLAYLRANAGLVDDNTDTGTGGTPGVNQVKTTVKKLRIRKSYTTSSAYLGLIELPGTILDYTRTQLNGSVTWYYIQYQGTYGWVMGTYVESTSSSGGGSETPTISDYGTVTITKKWTHIRKTAAGAQTGYHLNIGDVATMIGPAQEASGYTWYNIRTESGRTGWVRGDCADADFGSAGMPDTEAKYVQFLKDGMTITKGDKPSNASGSPVTMTKNTVLQLVSGVSYTEGGSSYVNVYYNNGDVYHTAYSADLIAGLLTTDALNRYIINTIWSTGLPTGTQAGETLGGATTIRTSDVYVHAIQAALYELGLYTDDVDGIYGPKTADAVKAYKNNYGKTPINETVSAADSLDLFAAGMAALQAKRNGTDGGSTVGDFGTVNAVKKGSWAEVDGGAKSLFPKGSMATVMSVDTKQVFRVWRWSGVNHADVVTYDKTDTAVLSSILGVTYNPDPPSASELALIKASGTQDVPDYTWPAFRWNGQYKTAGNAYKIPVWINLNGTVYCASIYVIPHGYDGTSSFSRATRDGQYYYKLNNMYGMMCVHFYGSKTHSSGVVDSEHAANIAEAYSKADDYFGASKVN